MSKKELYQVEIDPFNSPINNYIKYKFKLQKYNEIKLQSSFRYYRLITGKIVKRYFKTRLLSTVVNMVLMMFAMHCAEESGFLDYMVHKKEKLYDKIWRFISYIFRL
jgi:hypothetical protein